MADTARARWRERWDAAEEAFREDNPEEAERLHWSALQELDEEDEFGSELLYSYKRLIRFYSIEHIDPGQLERTSRRWLAVQEAMPAATGSEVAVTLYSLADAYTMQGKHDEAEHSYLRGIAVLEEYVGTYDDDFISSLDYLALYYEQRKIFQKSESIWQRSVAISEQVEAHRPEGMDDSLYSYHALHLPFARSALAHIYRVQEKYGDEEQIRRKILAELEERWGATHPAVVYPLKELAAACHAQGKHHEAEAFLRRALTVHDRLVAEHDGVPQTHPDDLLSLLLLYTSVLRALRREPQATGLAVRIAALQSEVDGDCGANMPEGSDETRRGGLPEQREPHQ